MLNLLSDKRTGGRSSCIFQGSRQITTAALLGAALVGASAQAQFSTVLNILTDPGLGADDVVDSDTQVNLFDGGLIKSAEIGNPDGTSTNVELNVFGGTLNSPVLNAGVTANISGGTSRLDIVDGAEQINITGGQVNGIDFWGDESVRTGLNISAGQVRDISYFGVDRINQVIQISGGVVGQTEAIGGDPFDFDGPLYNQGSYTQTGGTVFVRDLTASRDVTLTGGTHHGNVVVAGGRGLLDGGTVNGDIEAIDGGTLNLVSGSATSARVSPGATVNVMADVGLRNLFFKDAGTINVNGGVHDLDLVATYPFAFDPPPGTARLNLNGGTLGADAVRVEEVNVQGGDLVLGGYGSRGFQLNVSSGSVRSASSFERLQDLAGVHLTGGSIGDGLRFEIYDLNFPGFVVKGFVLEGGTVGDGVKFVPSFSSEMPILASGATIGHYVGFAGELHFSAGSIGNNAGIGALVMTGGVLGNNANIGTLVMTGGVLGDDAEVSGEVSLSAGRIGNNAIIDELVVTGGVLGDNAEVFGSVSLSAGRIGNNTIIEGYGGGDALVMTGGVLGDNAEVSGEVSLSAGRIGNNAIIDELVMTGGVLGDDAEVSGGVSLSAGRIGNSAKIENDGVGDALVMTGGVLGNDAVVFGGVSFSGGTVGERFSIIGYEFDIFASEFFLDGVELSEGLEVGDVFFVDAREVMLEGTLADGSVFDFFLSEDFRNVGVTDYFRPGTRIQVTLTEPVPEPSAAALFVVGGLLVARRRRRI